MNGKSARPKRLLLVGLLAAVLSLGGLSAAMAATPKKVQQQRTVTAANAPVELAVTVIHASKDGQGIDPRLKNLERYFKRSFKKFSRFKHLGLHQAKLAAGKSVREPLLGGKKQLEVKYLEAKDGFIKMDVAFDGARMTMKVRNGGLWFHAGRKHDGGILVLALRAKTTR